MLIRLHLQTIFGNSVVQSIHGWPANFADLFYIWIILVSQVSVLDRVHLGTISSNLLKISTHSTLSLLLLTSNAFQAVHGGPNFGPQASSSWAVEWEVERVTQEGPHSRVACCCSHHRDISGYIWSACAFSMALASRTESLPSLPWVVQQTHTGRLLYRCLKFWYASSLGKV